MPHGSPKVIASREGFSSPTNACVCSFLPLAEITANSPINQYISCEDLIRYIQDNFHFYQSHFGYSNFQNLFGREPTLIDLQNCFCETDKYLRVKIPELQVDNFKIKQKYRADSQLAVNDYEFPPKWNLQM
ncbi:hypothetical protein GS597_12955 [Synechococcales cyanobacterium C]|uniref:5-hmdU DNA kinase helical domain-containing protein n=1 Tax=Petrachloros mirabilis ULC683 TaxID=2781853 RepID=A0A8K2A8Y6_9CYAN|nr:hypothetical protein [Petrachloros mirabilis ULC683]